MSSPTNSPLARAAARFAKRHGITLDTTSHDAADALGYALLDQRLSAERRRWLGIVRHHMKASPVLPPAMSTGRGNAARRFLAQSRVSPSEVLPARRAELLIAAWDRAARRALRRPDEPVWRYEWWVDRRRRFRVTLSFADDGTAIVGYLGCVPNCGNASPRSASPDHMSETSATGSSRVADGATP